MDLNEKLAQRRREREMEAAVLDGQITNQKLKSKDSENENKEFSLRLPIENRIQITLNAELEKKVIQKRKVIERVKPWEWIVALTGTLGSIAAMSQSFFWGVLFLSAFVLYAKFSLNRIELEMSKEWSHIQEAKKLIQEFENTDKTREI